MILEEMTDSSLAVLSRYALHQVEAGRDRLEKAVGKGDLPLAYQTQGAIEEMRHIVAIAKSILHGRAKGQSHG